MIPARAVRLLLAILVLWSRWPWPESACADEAVGRPPTPARADALGDPLPDGAVARLGTLRLRHPGPGPALTLAPDGRRVASGGIDRQIRLWDAATGKELRHWDGGSTAIERLVFSPDGLVVAAAGPDGTVHLWDVDPARRPVRLESTGNSVTYLTFARDGRSLLSVDREGTARLWEMASGKQRRRWDVFRGQAVGRVGGHPERQFVALASSADLGTLAWATWRAEAVPGKPQVQYHGEVAVWDAATGKERSRLQGPALRPTPLALSDDGKTVALVLDSGKLSLWDAATGRLLREFPRVPPEPIHLAFLDGGRLLAVCGDRLVSLRDPVTGREVRQLGFGPDRRPDSYSPGFAFSADGKTAALKAHSRIALWDVPTGKPTFAFSGPIDAVRFSRDGKTLVALAGKEVRLYDTRTWAELRVLEQDRAGQPLAALAADGRWLTYQSDGETVRFLEQPGGKPRVRFRPEDFAFWFVPFGPDGKTVAVVRADRTVCLYDAEAGRGHKRIAAPVARAGSRVAFSPDGRRLAWVNPDASVSVVEAESGRLVYRLGEGYPRIKNVALIARGVHAVAFTPDGKALAAGGEYDNNIRLWDLATGKPLREFVGHTGPVAAVEVTPDGKTLASAGQWEPALRVWDVATGQPRRLLAGHADWATGLALAPDGKRLASSSRDGTVLVWEP
jgi:WD40 repeat protein